MFEDAITHREPEVTGEALYRSYYQRIARQPYQEETQDKVGCEVADEPVVATKAQRMKASNGVEEKTEPTISNESDGIYHRQKR